MAHYTYDIKLEKACPRCGSKTVIVAVYYFGETHRPRCKKCGLTSGYGDHKDLVESIIINCFYEYEKANSEEEL